MTAFSILGTMNETATTNVKTSGPDRYPDVVAVILAAGKGRRMGAVEQNKVCCPVAGRPAILRAMEVYRSAFEKHN